MDGNERRREQNKKPSTSTIANRNHQPSTIKPMKLRNDETMNDERDQRMTGQTPEGQSWKEYFAAGSRSITRMQVLFFFTNLRFVATISMRFVCILPHR